MIPVAELIKIDFFRGLREDVLAELAEAAEIRVCQNNEQIIQQHGRAIALYFLLSGRVQSLIHVKGHGDLLIGVEREPGALLGWSVFRAPYRYTTSARCEQECRFLRLPHHVFDRILEQDSETGLIVLQRVAQNLAGRILREWDRLVEENRGKGSAREHAHPFPKQHPESEETICFSKSSASALEIMQHSSFFGSMQKRHLRRLAGSAEFASFSKGDVLFSQGAQADKLFLLSEGKVALSYGSLEGDERIFLYTIGNEGELVGWKSLVEPRRYRVSCTAMEPTRVFALPHQVLDDLCIEEPEFGIALFRKVLQLIGSRLRATHVLFIVRRYTKETLAIRALLEQAATSLHVSSPLHKIPYLLGNRLTLADGFHVLELTRAHGDPLERNLAALCLDILEDVHRELDIYKGLQKAYESVANAPAETPANEVRRQSMEAFCELFRQTRYRIRGEENLPRPSGNIIIMNHLENHPDTQLPNEFRLTLDSHFVSSMILYHHYGEAPIRIIRKPPFGWYGHQQYFDRLDYIYVHKGDVDEEDRDQHITREERRQMFLDKAATFLRAGRNIVIAPEGQCRYTEDSPGPFKAGAFRLAASMHPEPLIVPIAVANFDKKISQTTLAAIVFQPFRLSDHVADINDTKALIAFVNAYQETFKDYVKKAIRLAVD